MVHSRGARWCVRHVDDYQVFNYNFIMDMRDWKHPATERIQAKNAYNRELRKLNRDQLIGAGLIGVLFFVMWLAA